MSFISFALFSAVAIASLSSDNMVKEFSTQIPTSLDNTAPAGFPNSTYYTSSSGIASTFSYYSQNTFYSGRQKPRPSQDTTDIPLDSGYTTFFPFTTLLTITSCSDYLCVPASVITSLVVPNKDEYRLQVSNAPSSVFEDARLPSAVLKTGEYTVTEFTTYCPEPTVFTYYRYSSRKRVPVAYTVTKATSVTINETCILNGTYMGDTLETRISDKKMFAASASRARILASTEAEPIITTLTTFVTEATTITVTACDSSICAPLPITVAKAASVTISNALIMARIGEYSDEYASAAVIKATKTISGSPTIILATLYPDFTDYFDSTCVDVTCVPSSTATNKAALTSMSGMVAADSTFAENEAAALRGYATPTSADNESLEAGSIAISAEDSAPSADTASPFAVPVNANEAAKTSVGILGLIVFAALLF